MEPMNYYPNSVASSARTKQTVRLTFGLLDYRKVVDVVVCGTGKGFYAIESALECALDGLYGDNGIATIVLVNAAGDRLICEDKEGREDDWLMDMLIRAEILATAVDTPAAGTMADRGAVPVG